ncbi:hypothetical protein HELRODRAFT_161653 [Helobdella robusta]|uniref:Uncharacterized protein n=1 Tax=Helobdella robusta TaxID=6412 RepID=T1ERR2_HELRO|nr:hypothetical protein HELRODRAFT_161653 [Helobdella robusta]ESO02388.1 hypothetical protein HELRODRAFT_161653 [Helobdella robusta]
MESERKKDKKRRNEVLHDSSAGTGTRNLVMVLQITSYIQSGRLHTVRCSPEERNSHALLVIWPGSGQLSLLSPSWHRVHCTVKEFRGQIVKGQVVLLSSRSDCKGVKFVEMLINGDGLFVKFVGCLWLGGLGLMVCLK